MEQPIEFTREIEFTPAWDKRNDDPKKNFGIHSAEMRWDLKGPKGVIQWVVFTNWNLPHVQEDFDLKIPGLAKFGPLLESGNFMSAGEPPEGAEVPQEGDQLWVEKNGESAFKMYHLFHKPQPADLGYHSFEPMYEGHEAMTKDCPVLGGKPCFYDGSGLAAEEVFKILVTKGHEAVWKYLESYYFEKFEKCPEVTK